MDTAFPWLPYLLQTADALFPTGAYAHSFGFEETVRLGVVHDESSLGEFLALQVIPALRDQELPYLRFAWHAAASGDVAALCALDWDISAWKLAFETRQASIQIGVRRLKALRGIADDPLLREYSTLVDSGAARGHHLVATALQASIEKLPLEAALAAYFYQALAAICAAALKLIRIGQDGCQRRLRHACRHSQEVIGKSLLVARENAGCFNPLLEIASMRHQRANERLFIS